MTYITRSMLMNFSRQHHCDSRRLVIAFCYKQACYFNLFHQ